MANNKSSKKRAKTNEKRRQHNVSRRSQLKTASRRVIDAVGNGDVQKAQELLVVAQKLYGRAVGKKVIKKNTAARKVSSLFRRVNTALG